MRRHTFDPISFIFGALFAAIGLTFLFGDADVGDIHLAVVWPLPLIVIGLLMLATTIQRRSKDQPAPVAAAPVVARPDDGMHTEELPDDSAFGEAETRHDLPFDDEEERRP